MAGVAIGESAVAGVEDAVEERDEFAGAGVAVNHQIDPSHYFVKIIDIVHLRTQGGADGGHDEAGGDAFAGDVGHHEADVVALQGNEIVEIAAEFEAGNVNGGEIEAGDFRGRFGDHPLLDVGGHLHLFFQSLRGEGFGDEPGVFDRGGCLGGDGFEEIDFQGGEELLLSGVYAQDADRLSFISACRPTASRRFPRALIPADRPRVDRWPCFAHIRIPAATGRSCRSRLYSAGRGLCLDILC